jgi:tetratricopeptide (TPR) repeat protein
MIPTTIKYACNNLRIVNLRLACLFTALAVACLVTTTTGCNSGSTGARPGQQASISEMPDLLPRSGETTPSPEFRKAQESVARLRAKIQERPEELKAYADLAQIYLQEARVSGRHHIYVPVAQRLLDGALARDSNNFEAMITKASLMMTLHRFEEAKGLANRAIALFPHNAFAYGVLCDAHVELGEYREAIAASDSMNAIRPDLRSYARASYLRELTGDMAGAIDAMTMAVNAGEPGDENRAWTMYMLGNLYLSEGKADTADRIYQAILEERPNYAFALNGRASVAAAHGHFPSAIELLVKASQLASEHQFIEHLGDLYLAMGHRENAGGIDARVLETFDQHEKGGWNIDREYALYCANHDIHLSEALMRARRDYLRRPGNIDALDTYAWTLYKNGRASEGLIYIEEAMKLGTRRADFHYHAGMIYQATGERAKAIAELNRSFNQSLYVNVLYLTPARNALESMKRIAMAE